MSSDLVQHVRRALDGHGIRNTTVVVAVSGGVDSMSLLAAMAELAPSLNVNIIACHAHHGLRGVEADDDQRFVVSVAAAMHLTCETERLSVAEHAEATGIGIEAAARELRYAYLLRVANQHQATAVLVGHTADDAAETLILHVARGSGIDGLASHRPHRQLGPKVLLIRPMLDVQRSEVMAFANSRNLRWREDSTNVELHFLRNRVRAEVMPTLREIFGSDVALRMARTARLLRDARTIVRSAIAAHAHLITQDEANHVHIALAPFHMLGPAEQGEIVRHALRLLTGATATYADTTRVLDLANAEAGSMATLTGRFEAWRERNEILLRHRTTTNSVAVVLHADGMYVAANQLLHVHTLPSAQVQIDPNVAVAYVDASVVSGPMVWREWQDGERFIPFGMSEAVLVADLLTNARVPASSRRQVRVVADNHGILWVCGIRPAERTRITVSTTSIITLRIE